MTISFTGGSGNLDQLKKKKIVKPQPVFIIKLKRGEFHDKRMDLDINRDSVLARLNKHINFRVIENKKKITDKEENIDITNEYKIPLLDGKQYGEYAYDIPVEENKPKKIKKFIISEKIGEELSKDFEFSEQLPEIGEEKEPEEISEIPEVPPEVSEVPKITEEVIKIKPKRGRKRAIEKEAIREVEKEEPEDIEEPEKVKEIGKKEPGKRGRTRKIYEQYQFDPNVKINKKAVINRLLIII